VNDGTPITDEVLDGHRLDVVASLLRFYLLELPDSLVSSNLYEVMKSIYSNPTTSDESSTQTRISVLQNALGHGQLPLVNVATLDAVTSHFVRLIDLTSADEAYTTQLAQIIAPCILRPRMETSVTFGEKYSYRFLRDILSHHKAIFSELKRVAAANLNRSLTVKPPADNGSSQIGPAPIPGRPRAISSDESNRKANMEERARAIATANANRSRASSPAPYPAAAHSSAASLEVRRHRRDSSKGPSDTRFPVAVSTASPRGPQSRPSLDVPKSEASSPVRERDRHLGMTSGLGDAAVAALAMHPINTTTNGTYKRSERDRDSATDTGSASPAPSLGLRKLSLGFNAPLQQQQQQQTQAATSQESLTATPTSLSSSSIPFSANSAKATGPHPSVLAGPIPGQHDV